MSTRARLDDRGSVTVELALTMLTALLVLACCAEGVLTVVDHLRCTDAAREAARLIARGDPESEARRAVDRIAPENATLTVTREPDAATVVVAVSWIKASAYAVLEDVDPEAGVAGGVADRAPGNRDPPVGRAPSDDVPLGG
ncbi:MULTISPECIES: TadE family type IV pilus minor pilin [Actinosynnema]|uniref:TadE family type IV pilus minor pilin n=1 Tax=Actinosynnema TaxID=40566 RepID=UPI0020A3B028|nr:TadE family type IV pilus minor pilin [Actinosynnema pretiosum]MCP2096937.1 TadE-like protein [Actinosynnema pretiosum]